MGRCNQGLPRFALLLSSLVSLLPAVTAMALTGAHITKSPLHDQLYTMHVTHGTIKQTIQLKFPEDVTIFVCWLKEALCKCIQLQRSNTSVQGGCEFGKGKAPK